MRNTFFLLALAAASQAVAVSPYISKVYEYRPAPGQFINVLPEIPAEASADEVNALVLEQIGHEKNAGMISLGVLWGYRDRATLEGAGAAALCEKPADLPAVIGRLGAPASSES